MRIKANIIVSAIMKGAGTLGLHTTIVNKGDVDAGQIYIVINNNNGGFLLLGPQFGSSINALGEKIWCFPLGAGAKSENDVNKYLEKVKQYDCDIYIVEVEDKTLEYRPTGEFVDMQDLTQISQKEFANALFKK